MSTQKLERTINQCMNTAKIYNNMHINATRTTLLIDDGDVMRKVNGSTHEILQRGQTTALGSRERHSEKLEKKAKPCATNGIRPKGKRLKTFWLSHYRHPHHHRRHHHRQSPPHVHLHLRVPEGRSFAHRAPTPSAQKCER